MAHEINPRHFDIPPDFCAFDTVDGLPTEETGHAYAHPLGIKGLIDYVPR